MKSKIISFTLLFVVIAVLGVFCGGEGRFFCLRAAAASSEEVVKEEEASKELWTEDWEKAQAEAKAKKKPVFLLFTGSDWCGYCIRLEKKVLGTKEFKKYAAENLILMKADYPMKKQDAKIKEQNKKLGKKYKVSGYPTVYLLSSELKELGTIGGYGGWTTEEYIQKIEEKTKAKAKAQ